MTAPQDRRELSESELCNLDAAPKRRTMDPCNVFFDAGPRQELDTLGSCLQEAARNQPAGYTRITGGENAYSCRWPCDETPDLPWLSIDPVTASIEPAPVTVHIAAGTTPKAARRILKLMRQWLKTRDSLEGYTPAPRDSDEIPF